MERDILARIAAAKAAAEEARLALRAAEKELDALRLAARPTYPLEAHRTGITEAARRIRERVPCQSHHGEPCPGRAVRVHGVSGWIGVWSDAPYAANGGGRRLWDFSDDDAQALCTLIEAEGLVVVNWWRHEAGLSFTTRVVGSVP